MSERLQVLLYKLQSFNIFPQFGVEIEFYILGNVSDDDIQNTLKYISNETSLEIQLEKGYRQYEVATTIYSNVFQLINVVNQIKNVIVKAGGSLSPKPYINDYGSAMHIHMSLCDDSGQNLFNQHETIEQNTLLLHTIAGILQLLNASLYMLISNDEIEFARLHSTNMSPSTLSWGRNNRTTAIRIPDSLPSNINRRIEFRVPSVQSEISINLLFLLTSAIYGIEHALQPIGCIYGNANDEIYDIEKLYDNLSDAKYNFHFWKIFDELCKIT